MFTNLISNAIKFTEQGNILVKLRSKLQNNGRKLIQIMVQDDGIGIKPEHQASIFSPFRQSDSETTRRYGGTGLGLSIVAQIRQLGRAAQLVPIIALTANVLVGERENVCWPV
nr:ATP-binding protein [Alteromonas confluentis]